ncbi:PH domain-containing protein [Metabacillus idriensis]|uniref:PH domain-containing protein n=1 Tax=Metabacillus idriensis TaxID=324768 RepID=UPI002813C997|nr:PH domain-containing protein [Metabacillus idriensis]MDR0140235.1 PH domain-containing protein [Metabacillus idriensis]
MMSEPKRLHPASAILTFFKQLKDGIFPVIVLFFVNDYKIYFFIGLAVILIAMIIYSIISWMKYTYRIEDNELRIEFGLFIKKKRYIPIERIQSINESAGIIQQIFGLVKLQLETAGGGAEAEAVLTAVTKEEARRIHSVLAERKKELDHDEIIETVKEEKTYLTYKIGAKELMVAASTSSGIGVVLSAAFAFFSQFDELIPFDDIIDRFSILSNASITVYAILVFIAFFIAWILSIIGVCLKFANFTVVKKEKDLVISRGLFEKHQLTIPLERIQAMKISENLIRQPLGYATVHIVSAGGSAKDENVSAVLFPLIKKTKIKQILTEFTPDFSLADQLNPLPKRARRGYVLVYTIPFLVISCILSYFLQPWGYLALLTVPAGLLIGLASFKDAGWAIHAEQLTLSSRNLVRSTFIVKRKRIQVIEARQSFFQRRLDLASIQSSTTSGLGGTHFLVKGVDIEDAGEVFEWYSYENHAKKDAIL